MYHKNMTLSPRLKYQQFYKNANSQNASQKHLHSSDFKT
ncbi:hypothetical protein O23A_p0671 [Aeromonas salmonicida]|nr:hypothetical protein O23A_p0671 [Aeromonas salmonicida]